MSSSLKFQAKLYLIRDGDDDFIESLLVFCNELDMVDRLSSRQPEDWVRSHLQDGYHPISDLREVLSIPKDENSYHVLFSGTMNGYGPDFNGEYDEDMDVDDRVKYVQLSREWLKSFWKYRDWKYRDWKYREEPRSNEATQ